MIAQELKRKWFILSSNVSAHITINYIIYTMCHILKVKILIKIMALSEYIVDTVKGIVYLKKKQNIFTKGFTVL